MRRALQVVPGLDETPQVQAVLERGGRTVVVRCPFCRRNHIHGVPNGSYGARNSHCHDREPRSYILVPATA